jgi:ABC-type lipoprotein release transport system permease subunit
VIGLAMGFAVEQLLKSMLFNAGGVDTVAYVVVSADAVCGIMLTAYVPARKGARINLTQALRYE